MENRGKKDKSLFSNPVYKKISLKNGEINKMKHSELMKLAITLKLDREGSTEILRKRLKSHYRNEFLNDASLKMPRKSYPYYIVIDFEATCDDKESPQSNFPHEIIEFPAVIVNSKTLAVEDVFHEYVKPVVNKTLTDYCTTLTGISQSQVSSADTFPGVLERFMEWVQQHKLIGRSAIVADGPWDMGHFLYRQVKLSKLPYPKFAKQWVNIKKTFSNFYDQRKPSLDVMLQKLNFEFVGRRHSGIDDSRNIARVLIQMLKDGAYVHINEKIDLSTFQSQAERPISEVVRPAEEREWCIGEFSEEDCDNLQCKEETDKKEGDVQVNEGASQSEVSDGNSNNDARMSLEKKDDVQMNEGACKNENSDENSNSDVLVSLEKKGDAQVNEGASQNEVSDGNSNNDARMSLENKGDVQVNEGGCKNENSDENSNGDVLVSLEKNMRAVSLHLSRNIESDFH